VVRGHHRLARRQQQHAGGHERPVVVRLPGRRQRPQRHAVRLPARVRGAAQDLPQRALRRDGAPRRGLGHGGPRRLRQRRLLPGHHARAARRAVRRHPGGARGHDGPARVRDRRRARARARGAARGGRGGARARAAAGDSARRRDAVGLHGPGPQWQAAQALARPADAAAGHHPHRVARDRREPLQPWRLARHPAVPALQPGRRGRVCDRLAHGCRPVGRQQLADDRGRDSQLWALTQQPRH
jgi:hypothetical protein